MEEKKWYYSKDGKAKGPLIESEMMKLFHSGEVKGHDLLFCENHPEWKKAYDWPVFSQVVWDKDRSTISQLIELPKDSVGENKDASMGTASREWIILVRSDGDDSEVRFHQEGPFHSDQVKKLLLEGKIKLSDHCWTKGFEKWIPLPEIPEFRYDRWKLDSHRQNELESIVPFKIESHRENDSFEIDEKTLEYPSSEESKKEELERIFPDESQSFEKKDVKSPLKKLGDSNLKSDNPLLKRLKLQEKWKKIKLKRKYSQHRIKQQRVGNVLTFTALGIFILLLASWIYQYKFGSRSFHSSLSQLYSFSSLGRPTTTFSSNQKNAPPTQTSLPSEPLPQASHVPSAPPVAQPLGTDVTRGPSNNLVPSKKEEVEIPKGSTPKVADTIQKTSERIEESKKGKKDESSNWTFVWDNLKSSLWITGNFIKNQKLNLILEGIAGTLDGQAAYWGRSNWTPTQNPTELSLKNRGILQGDYRVQLYQNDHLLYEGSIAIRFGDKKYPSKEERKAVFHKKLKKEKEEFLSAVKILENVIHQRTNIDELKKINPKAWKSTDGTNVNSLASSNNYFDYSIFYPQWEGLKSQFKTVLTLSLDQKAVRKLASSPSASERKKKSEILKQLNNFKKEVQLLRGEE